MNNENISKIVLEALSNGHVTHCYKSIKNTKKAYYATFPDGSRFKSMAYQPRITWFREEDLKYAIRTMARDVYNNSSVVRKAGISLEDFTNEVLSVMTIHELNE